MTLSRFLKTLCDKCEFCAILKGYEGCPFRSNFNDYCPWYGKIMDILKEHEERERT